MAASPGILPTRKKSAARKIQICEMEQLYINQLKLIFLISMKFCISEAQKQKVICCKYPLSCLVPISERAYLDIGYSGAVQSRLYTHGDGVEKVATAFQDEDIDVEDPTLRPLEHAELPEIKHRRVTVGP